MTSAAITILVSIAMGILGAAVTLILVAVRAASAWGGNQVALAGLRDEVREMRATAANTLGRIGVVEGDIRLLQAAAVVERRTRRDMRDESRGIPNAIGERDEGSSPP